MNPSFFSRSRVVSVERVLVLQLLKKITQLLKKKPTKQWRLFTFNADVLYHFLMQLLENLFVCHLSC